MRDAFRSPPGRRFASVALTAAAHVLLFLLLWTLARQPPRRDEEEPPLSTFTVQPSPQAAPRPAPRPAPRAATTPVRAAPAPARPAAATTPPPPAPPPLPVPAERSVPRTDALDSFDLAGLTRGRDRPEPTGDSRSLSYGPGEGPGGLRLYNAEWQREPTPAQLRTYLPADMPRPAWALIACRTVENYGVENCRALGEHPLGSGLARAMRLASWQFRVHPPRLGGKKLVGAWVRIRIDFTLADKE